MRTSRPRVIGPEASRRIDMLRQEEHTSIERRRKLLSVRSDKSRQLSRAVAARQRRRVLLLLRRLPRLACVRGLDDDRGAIVGEAVGCDARNADSRTLLPDPAVSDGIERECKLHLQQPTSRITVSCHASR